MTDSNRQEAIAAHNALAALVCFGQVHSVDPEEAEWIKIKGKEVAAVLPPRPRPTMAEIEWGDEHFLAEAEHPDYGLVIMLSEGVEPGVIHVMCCEDKVDRVYQVSDECLTPTGRRYTLTDTRQWGA